MLTAISGALSGATAAANERDSGDPQKEITPPSFMTITSTTKYQAPAETSFAERRA
ncbi:hypothetical protein [Streptomyces sp. BA2]|uniref:hypothetical protein n=1 Tax=Streptomyces sp. BA2 TaxID=436595 RepID=UPI001320B7EC|nr:hypothetical protein [Streptomyces sp. BA2]MWA07907.1 hypothetical protein [Streptomyces sp. BA2]